MKYELTVRQLDPFTEEEMKEVRDRESRDRFNGMSGSDRYSDKPVHEVRVLNVEVTAEELKAIKKAVIEVM